LVTNHTKIQGHTGGSFFFTGIWSPTIPKFRGIQEGLSFSPEFGHRPYQNSGTYRRVFLFHQNFEKETPYEKEAPFENISNLALPSQLGLG
jgi:hypothetical protein